MITLQTETIFRVVKKLLQKNGHCPNGGRIFDVKIICVSNDIHIYFVSFNDITNKKNEELIEIRNLLFDNGFNPVEVKNSFGNSFLKIIGGS